MPCVDIGTHHGVELHYPEAKATPLFDRIEHQALPYMKPSLIASHSIAAVAYVSAAADVIGMEDVQPNDLSIRIGYSSAALG